MFWKKSKYQSFLIIYFLIVFLYAVVVFTYAYFYDAKTIPHYQFYESAVIDVDVSSVPNDTESYIEIIKTPISKINDYTHDGFNEDTVTLILAIKNNSTFSVKNLLSFLPSPDNHNSLVYWIGVDRDNNYQDNILDDIGVENTNDFLLLKNALENKNNITLDELCEHILLPSEELTITFVFWMEWDEKPQDLNLEFSFLLSLKTVQANGDF